MEKRREEVEESIDLAELIGQLWRNRFWFALSMALALLAGVIYLKHTPNRYSRSATILIRSNTGGMPSTLGRDMMGMGNNEVANEMGVLMSRRLMMRVVEQLNLQTNYQLKSGMKRISLYNLSPIALELMDERAQQARFEMELLLLTPERGRLRYEVMEPTHQWVEREREIELGSEIETEYGRLKWVATPYMHEEYLGKPLYISKEETKRRAKEYVARLGVTPFDKQSSLVNLSIVDDNAQRAEDLLNALIGQYEESVIAEKNRMLKHTISFVTEKVEVLEEELRLIDTDIEKYKKEHKLTDISSVSSMYLQNYSKIDAEVLLLENQLSIAHYMKEYLAGASAQTELIPSNIGLNHTAIDAQVARYNELMTQRNRYLTNSSAENPVVKDLQLSLLAMRGSIVSAVDNLIESLNIQLKKYSKEEQKSSSRIANVSSQHKFIINIERQLKIKEDLYLYLLKILEENEIKLTGTESNSQIVDEADGSDWPVEPRRMIILLVSLLIGAALPAIWLYLRALFSHCIYTKKELKSALDIPILGELPQATEAGKTTIVVEDGNRDVINEAFRLLRDNLKMMSMQEEGKGKVLLVTSLNPASGKTFITSNLAMTISLSGKRVVILDIDLRKGSLTKRLGYSRATVGLSNYLSGRTHQVEELITRYQESQMEVITSGALPPNPAELLKNGRLGQLVEELRSRYDYIIFDTAPYGLVSDCGICGQFADMTLMIVRSGLFDKRQLPEVEELYVQQLLPQMSLLLNGVSLNKMGYGGEYRYGYGNVVKKNARYYIRKVLGI